MNVESVAEELAARLRRIPGLQAHTVPPGSIVAPAAVVAFPSRVDFDLSGDRGTDSATFPVLVMAAKVGGSINAWGILSKYLNGSGAYSVKAALEDSDPVAGVLDFVQVEDGSTEVTKWGDIEYLTLSFTVTVVGSGI